VKYADAPAADDKSGLGDDSLIIFSRKDSKKPKNRKRDN